MSLIERDSTQKVLNIEGLNYLLKKLKSSHMDKIATDSVLGHVKIGPTVTPTSINGEGIAAPSYHTHPAQTEISGNAGTATKLKNPVNIALSGQVTGNADFDGSKNITIKTTIDNNGKIITGVTSLDKLQPGDYIESGGSKYTDSPLGSTSTGKFIIQVVGTDAEKTQIFTDPATGKVYYRIIENGVAGDWYEILVKKNGNIDGNALSADKLKIARTIAISGDADGSTTFDGSKNVDIGITLSDTGVDAGTYGSNSQSNFNATKELTIPVYTVDDAGRLTSSSNQTIKIPTTSSGEGGSSGLTNPVTIALSGDVTGSKVFDGTTDITIDTTLKNSGATAGSYGETAAITLATGSSFKVPNFNITAKGIVSSASTVTVSVPSTFGDEVKSSPTASGKIYLSGKTTSTESTSNDVHNSGLYYDVDSKTLTAPNISGNFTGSASSAKKLTAAVNIGLTGDTTGTTSFDGSKSVSIATTLANSGVTAGSYGLASKTTVGDGTTFNIPNITVDAKGRVTLASNSTVSVPATALNRVKTTPATSGIIYITGKTSSEESTTTEVLSPNLYYDVDNNTFHAGKIAATIEGVSGTANKLSVARNINLSGDATGTAAFDGSKDVTINTTLKDSGAKAGTYGNTANVSLDGGSSFVVPKFTITAKGIVTSSETTTVSLPAGNLNKVKSSPTTTGKIYLSGKTSATESTSTDVHNSGLYYDTDTKTLVAPNISGKATSASEANKLTTARNIALTGDATGTASFDGTADASIKTTLSNSGVTAGTYGTTSQDTVNTAKKVTIPKVSVDAKGRVTSASDQIILLPVDADTAVKLANAMKLTASGDATGAVSFDGSANVELGLTLSNSGVTAGKYGQQLSAKLGTDQSVIIPYITVDSKGRITSIKNTTFAIPSDSFNKVKTDLATDGYIFISGKNELVEGDGTEVINSNLYYDVKNKILHAGKIAATIEGVSDSANKLAKAVNINLVGAVKGSHSFDGSTSIDINTTIDTVTNEEIDAMMDA